jgi:transglutaminase-like putative cysteine protease
VGFLNAQCFTIAKDAVAVTTPQVAIRPNSAPRFSTREVGIAITVALYLLCVGAVGSRIFTDGSYLGPITALILIGQILFLITLALGAPRWICAAVASAGIGISVTHLHAAGSHWYGLPTAQTWELVSDELSLARSLFSTAATPVEYESWAMVFSIAIAISAILTLVFAQVVRTHFEALVPGATLFIFLSVLGAGPGGLRLTVFVIISGYLMTATLRGSSHVSVARLVTTGATIALIGSLAVPYLPGAHDEPWIMTRGRFGVADTRLSPLVDIQGRLVSQSTTEMFQVESSEPAYWRMLTLTEFDGRRFTAPSAPLSLTGQSEPARAARGPTPRILEQSVRITALGGNLLPTAAVPIAASADPPVESEDDLSVDVELQWDPDISAVVRSDRDLLPEDSFQLRSVITEFQISDLLSRTAFSPPDPIHLSLPEDFPQSVIDMAAEIIARTGPGTETGPSTGSNNTVRGGREPYFVARTLQDWFRSEFDYSLEIPPGHGSAALERFLENRVGYCEQFAAAFVAMARSQGLPSRVAVGFTPGIQRQLGVYAVQGRHAHAWPEVWFDGLGWVPFEPTPGRGLPGSEQHTGLAAQQDGPLELDQSTSEGSSGFDSLDQIPDLSDLIDGPDLAEDLDSQNGTDPSQDGDSIGGTQGQRLLMVLALGLLALVLGPWIVRQLRARRRHRLPPEIEVVAMWQGQLQHLRRHGVITDKAMTVTEILRVAPQRIPALSTPLTGLGMIAMEMGFSRDPVISEDALAQCRQWDKELTSLMNRRRGPLSRAIAYFAIWRDRPTYR